MSGSDQSSDPKKEVKKAESASDAALQEGVDFYFNEEGLMVLTREFLLKRGFCCHSGCENCPY